MIDQIVTFWNQLHHQGKLYLVFSIIYVLMGIIFIGQIDDMVEVLKQIKDELSKR